MHVIDFPGDPVVSRVLQAVLGIGLLIAAFVLVLRIILYYCPASSPGNKLLGFVVGTGVGLIMAKFYAAVYGSLFHTRPDHLSIVVIAGALVNAAISHHCFLKPPDSGGTP